MLVILSSESLCSPKTMTSQKAVRRSINCLIPNRNIANRQASSSLERKLVPEKMASTLNPLLQGSLQVPTRVVYSSSAPSPIIQKLMPSSRASKTIWSIIQALIVSHRIHPTRPPLRISWTGKSKEVSDLGHQLLRCRCRGFSGRDNHAVFSTTWKSLGITAPRPTKSSNYCMQKSC